MNYILLSIYLTKDLIEVKESIFEVKKDLVTYFSDTFIDFDSLNDLNSYLKEYKKKEEYYKFQLLINIYSAESFIDNFNLDNNKVSKNVNNELIEDYYGRFINAFKVENSIFLKDKKKHLNTIFIPLHLKELKDNILKSNKLIEYAFNDILVTSKFLKNSNIKKDTIYYIKRSYRIFIIYKIYNKTLLDYAVTTNFEDCIKVFSFCNDTNTIYLDIDIENFLKIKDLYSNLNIVNAKFTKEFQYFDEKKINYIIQ